MKLRNKFSIVLALLTAITFWLQLSSSALAIHGGQGGP